MSRPTLVRTIVDEPDSQQNFAYASRPTWRWPVSYRSAGIVVGMLDVVIIFLTAMVSGMIYSQFAFENTGDWTKFAGVAAAVIGLYIPMASTMGLYETSSILSPRRVGQVALLWVGVFLFLASIVFALKIGKEFSRGAVISLLVSGGALLMGHRMIWRSALRQALRGGNLRGRRLMLLSGKSDEVSRKLVPGLLKHGFSLERHLNFSDAQTPEVVAASVIEAVRGSNVEEIAIAFESDQWRMAQSIAQSLRALPLPVVAIPDGQVRDFIRRSRFSFGDIVSVEMQRAPLSLPEQMLKRSIDLAGALTGLVLLTPLLLLTAIAIKLDTSGPILFKQRRQGFNGKQFVIFKFRTMSVMEDGENVKQAQQFDRRVTRVGRWLRSSSIDELPQLLNVLTGEMSLVGPRPHALAHDNYYAQQISNYAFRHHMKPGITGWAQANGARGETPDIASMKRRIELDQWYVDNWTIWLDFKIILKTVFAITKRQNAY